MMFGFPELTNWFLPWSVAKIDDSERLRPEELNQQNIEALVAENNLVPIIIVYFSICFP